MRGILDFGNNSCGSEYGWLRKTTEGMMDPQATNVWNLALPWSDGSLSARLWQKGKRVVVGVPELDILCTGKSQSEAVFRLFTTLLKYYQQLKSAKLPLDDRQTEHQRLLKGWVASVERRMTQKELSSIHQA
jgi:hypothetical protein